MALSDTRIRAAKPAGKPYRQKDGHGLYLQVNPSGARLWRFRYRLAGVENMFAIGAYPEVSLADAREARDAARKLVRRGVHPSHERKAEKLRTAFAHAGSFERVARDWLEQNKPHWTPRTYRQRKNLLEAEAFPAIGAMPLKQVTTADCHAIITRIAQRAPQMAVIFRQALSGISALGAATLRGEDRDLGWQLRKAVRLAPTVHKAILAESEIPEFFERLERYPGAFPTKAALRLQWWTLCRPGEAIGASWTEFDLDKAVWTVPAARMKQRREHVFPLPMQAVTLLKQLRAVTGASPYLVPNRADPKRRASPCVLSKALESIGYSGKLSPHGIRATGRTLLGEHGHPEDLLELQLAHRRDEVRAAYDQGIRLEARRAIMQRWADQIDAICAGSNVVPLKRAS